MELASVLIAAASLLIALGAVYFARETVLEARRDALRGQYVQIGGLIEAIFFATDSQNFGFKGTDWIMLNGQLAIAMVGHLDQLPACAAVLEHEVRSEDYEALRRAAHLRVAEARAEVPRAIAGLDQVNRRRQSS